MTADLGTRVEGPQRRVTELTGSQLLWAAASLLLLALGAFEISGGERWDSPWPVSVLTLVLVGVPVAVVARRPVLAVTVVCVAFGVECLVWSTPQSLAALVAFVAVVGGAARHSPARALVPVLGLATLTVVVVLSPDPGEDVAFDYLFTSGFYALATGAGLLSRSGNLALARVAGAWHRGAVTHAPAVTTPITPITPATSTRSRVYLHIGLPKTGTSYLQSVCARSEEALAGQGLALLPRSNVTAFQAMLDLRDELRPELDPPEHFGALDRLVAEVRDEALPRALVSQELLCLASSEQVGRLVAALPDTEVHVVVTVRDLARQLPSLWQQQVKARGTTSFDQFLDRVAADGSGAARGHDVVTVLDQWRAHVPPERIHVVTVPRPGSATGLPTRFASVVGVDAASLDLAGVEENLSLGMAQAELLRRVNVALGDRLPHARAGYRGPGKRFLAETVLIQQEGRPPRLPTRLRPWVEERSRRVVDALRAEPYDVVGDLDELVPDPGAFEGDGVTVTDAQVLDAATEALAAVLVDRAEGRGRGRRARGSATD